MPKRRGGNTRRGHAGVDGTEAARLQEAQLDAELDRIASMLAFQEVARMMPAEVLPGSADTQFADHSQAILQTLWHEPAEAVDGVSEFFQGQAIWTAHAEGDSAEYLRHVYAYVTEHPASMTGLRELQALVCFHEGFRLSGSLMRLADADTLERTCQLFASGFILSDTAFSRLMNCSAAAPRFGGVEAMQRCSSKLLSRHPEDLPALLVQSRLQFGDDHSKLRIQQRCMELIEADRKGEWTIWRARLYEMIGLTFGGLGEHRSAADHYALSLQSGGSRQSLYLQAQCMHAMGGHTEALAQLEAFLGSIADEKALDDYLFPNALYLKGKVMAVLQNLGAARTCYKQGMGAELKRCPFFEPVSSVAKSSLQRIVRVAFGGAAERADALREFAEMYAGTGRAPDSESGRSCAVGLSEIGPAELVADTPKSGSRSSGSSALRVHILELARHPTALEEVLLHGEDLAPCRDALRARGLEPRQPSGATIFVDPDDLEPVLAALQGRCLKPWHVVVSSSHFDAVQSALGRIRSREQVRQKSNTVLAVSGCLCQHCGEPQPRFTCGRCKAVWYCSNGCQRAHHKEHVSSCSVKSDLEFVVSRTFLHIKIPSSMCSKRSEVTKSTTDADARKGLNPRSA